MREGFKIGLGLGIIVSFLFNLFIVWGGSPRGIYWQIDDLRQEITRVDAEATSIKEHLARTWLEEQH